MEGKMRIYLYDEITKEYLYSEEAFKDPLESALKGESVYILPPNGTFVEPRFPYGMANIWNGTAWEQVEDNRGKEYWLDTDEYNAPARVMEELGKFPENAVFEAPKQTLESAREEKLSELKKIRDEMEVQTIEYNYHFFDFDDKARERLSHALTALSVSGESIMWTTADDEDVEVTSNDIAGIIASAAVRSDSLHKQYRALKDKVNSLETVEEVKEVTWE